MIIIIISTTTTTTTASNDYNITIALDVLAGARDSDFMTLDKVAYSRSSDLVALDKLASARGSALIALDELAGSNDRNGSLLCTRSDHQLSATSCKRRKKFLSTRFQKARRYYRSYVT